MKSNSQTKIKPTYSKFQQIVSMMLIFFMLTSMTVRLPFYALLNYVFAEQENEERVAIVSIFVETNLMNILNDVYGEASTTHPIVKYGKNIQSVLPKTKTVIIPTPADTTPYDIATINERLFFEGYKGIYGKDGRITRESKLIGSVFVGNLPLPVVHEGNEAEKTIFPYVDFFDKGYIYDHEEQKYKKNGDLKGEIEAEIWHGVIASNPGKGKFFHLSDTVEALGLTEDQAGTVSACFKNRDDPLVCIGETSGEEIAEETFENTFGLTLSETESCFKYRGFSSINYCFSRQFLDIIGYFDKNNEYYDFYRNGNSEDREITDAKLFTGSVFNTGSVFYYDKLREEQSVIYNNYLTYQRTQENIEDLAYLRYSNELASSLAGDMMEEQTTAITDMLGSIGSTAEMTGGSMPDLSASPDILSREVIKGSTKSFPEVFNKSKLGTMQKYVHNAGRFNGIQKEVNIDIIPKLVGVLDAVSKSVIRKANSQFEKIMDERVENGLAREIVIPMTVKEKEKYEFYWRSSDPLFPIPVPVADKICEHTYTNMYYGTPASDITRADQCSIYRGSVNSDGSGQLVESNRAYNLVSHIENDITLLQNDNMSCVGETSQTLTWFGGFSPLNLDQSKIPSGVYEFAGVTDYNKPLMPLFDTGGSLKTTDSSKIHAPSDCENYNFLATNIERPYNLSLYKPVWDLSDKNCSSIYKLPLDTDYENSTIGSRKAWTCNEQYVNGDNPFFNSSVDLNLDFKNYLHGGDCSSGSDGTYTCNINYTSSTKIPSLAFNRLDKCVKHSKIPTSAPDSWSGGDYYKCSGKCSKTKWKQCEVYIPKFNTISNSSRDSMKVTYKKIPSIIKHKSPTKRELIAQAIAKITPNVPIDRDRYVAFKAANGNNAIMYYPNFFRLTAPVGEELTPNVMSGVLNDYLRDGALWLNALKNSYDPSNLSGEDLTLYNAVKTGDFASVENFDFHDEIDNNIELFPSQTIITTDNKEKVISFKDTLSFAVYWNNLTSAAAKYKFVLENYLADTNGGESSVPFYLPGNKGLYEVAYIGAPGTAQNMYASLDPEGKAENPFADMLALNEGLDQALTASNAGGSSTSSASTYLCAPPEGATIGPEWWNAVLCWVDNLKPVLKPGKCAVNEDDEELSEEDKDKFNECNQDTNNNGINDCQELNSDIQLSSDGNRFPNNGNGLLQAQLLNEEGELNKFDSLTEVKFELIKVLLYEEEGNRVIYDTTAGVNDESAMKEVKQYIAFNEKEVVVSGGKAENSITFKGKKVDIDVYFRATAIIGGKEADEEKGIEAEEPLIALSSAEINQEDIQLKLEARDVTFTLSPTKIPHLKSPLDIVKEDANETNIIIVSEKPNIFIFDNYINGIKAQLDTDKLISIQTDHKANEKLILTINYKEGNQQKVPNYPLSVQVFKKRGATSGSDPTDTGIPIIEDIVFDGGGLDINPLIAIQRSGTYIVKLSDKYNIKTETELTVIAEHPTDIIPELKSEVVEAESGNMVEKLMENKVYLLDRFGNKTVTHKTDDEEIPMYMYDESEFELRIDIDGEGANLVNILGTTIKKVGEEDDDVTNPGKLLAGENARINLTDKELIFYLQPTNIPGYTNIQFNISDDILPEQSLTLTTAGAGSIEPNITLTPIGDSPQEPTVGNNSYKLTLDFSHSGNPLTNFNSEATPTTPELFGTFADNPIEIRNGRGETTFTTSTTSGDPIRLSFRTKGIKEDEISEIISISPLKPMKADYSLSLQNIESIEESASKLTVELKDRYGNIVDDDETIISLTIPDRYKNVVTPTPKIAYTPSSDDGIIEDEDSKDIIVYQKATNGRASFTMSGTVIPGIAYFKIGTTPSLENNTFSVPGQGPFLKTQLDYISGMRNPDKTLSHLGAKYFSEIDDLAYKSKFYSSGALSRQLMKDKNEISALSERLIRKLWERTNTVTIRGVGENAGVINSSFIWRESNIRAKKFNALYTTMIGGPFGDFTEPDYLAQGILFNGNNRGLAVTSLLNNPKKYNDLVSFHSQGNIKIIESADMTQNVTPVVMPYILSDPSDGDSERTKDFFNIHLANEALGTNVGDIVFKFNALETLLNICETPEGEEPTKDLENCTSSDESKSSIFIKSLNESYTANYANERVGLSLQDGQGNYLFRISDDTLQDISSTAGDDLNKYVVLNSATVEIDTENTGNHAGFIIKSIAGEEIGYLGFSLNGTTIQTVYSQEILNEKLLEESEKSMIYIYLNSYNYKQRRPFLGNSTNGERGLNIWYDDPAFPSTSLSKFSKTKKESYENYEKKEGIGWKEGNKTILSFAAGDYVGEAVKRYQGFSVINLGDPVVRLNKKLKAGHEDERSFDSSIGKVISIDDKNIGYQIFDYNSDNKLDLILLKKNGFVELHEKTDTAEEYINRGNLVHMPDLGKDSKITVGDFSNETEIKYPDNTIENPSEDISYDDIFTVSKSGEPMLLNNDERNFYRYPLDEELTLSGKVKQFETFDMDNDTVTDIVTLDNDGKIHIFFGSNEEGTDIAPKFEKVLVADGLGIILNYDPLNPRRDNGSVYFEELYQIPDPLGSEVSLSDETEAIRSQIRDNINNYMETEGGADEFENPDYIDEEVVNGLIFEQLSYNPEEGIKSDSEDEEEDNSSPGDPDSPDAKVNVLSTFIKSDYAKGAGLKVEKLYKDVNGGYLKDFDKVEISVELINQKGWKMHNVAYLEKLPPPFIMPEEFIVEVNGEEVEVKDVPGGDYTFMIDHFDIPGSGSAKITFTVDTAPFSFGKMEVGYFSETNDHFGDIVFRTSEKNCGGSYDIFKSRSTPRTYDGKETVAPKCDATKNDLPKEFTDEDDDGIPDYLNKIMDDPESDEFTTFTEEAEALISGIDEAEDLEDDDAPEEDEDDEDDGVTSLDELNAEADAAYEAVSALIQGFGCGFGGGGCIASPLNWAPLAAGGDPTILGMLAGDGLSPIEGFPAFAAMVTPGPFFGLPFISVFGAPTPGAPPLSAGGQFGLSSAFIRIFVSPTLTGAMGTAICFGPNYTPTAWQIPPAMNPLVPGGNCIIIAFPMNFCSDDGSDGDPGSTGPGGGGAGGGFGAVNGNCPGGAAAAENEGKNPPIPDQTVEQYLKYLGSGIIEGGFTSKMMEALGNVASPGSQWDMPDGALFSVDGGEGGTQLDISMNLSELGRGNFSKAFDVSLSRVGPFPGIIMDWVTRQIEEIVGKLTDFTVVYIILPDFSGFGEAFEGNMFSGEDSKFNKAMDKKKRKQDKKLKSLSASMKKVVEDWVKEECGPDKDSIEGGISPFAKMECIQLSSKYEELSGKMDQESVLGSQVLGGWASVLDALSNLPLLSIEQEKIPVNIPWPEAGIIMKTLMKWRLTAKQWEEEIITKGQSWTGYCNGVWGDIAPEDQESCTQWVTAGGADLEKLISSIERNIEILESYLTFPERLYGFLTFWQDWIDQILCNMEALVDIFFKWMEKNAKIFKGWVDLIILIKAVLKTWQAIVDLFLDFEAECGSCKNERYDLIGFIISLISMLIPDLPILIFPKWPDIIIDLHNIRAGITVTLPDIEFKLRPIILPDLPKLILPDIPLITINLDLPTLPLLPELELPVLPDIEIPAIPSIELPSIPPAPKLPMLPSSIDIVITLIKLIKLIMCLLKNLPFVPEWRSGDQIAFITERGGFLNLDFLKISFPQFSYPFLDALKVTTYVNFNLESDTIIENVREAVRPWNSQVNNFVQLFNIKTNDLDFSDMVPDTIDINISEDGVEDIKMDGEEEFKRDHGEEGGDEQSFNNYKMKDLVEGLAVAFVDIVKRIQVESNKKITPKEFYELAQKSITSEEMMRNPKLNKVRKILKDAKDYTYTKENAQIKKLQNNMKEKFDTLDSIINTEREIIKNMKKSLKSQDGNFASVDNGFSLVSEINDKRFDEYNKRLEKYNFRALQAFKKAIGENVENNEIKEAGDELVARVKEGIGDFKKKIEVASDERQKDLLSKISTKLKDDINLSPDIKQVQDRENKIQKTESKEIIESNTDNIAPGKYCKYTAESYTGTHEKNTIIPETSFNTTKIIKESPLISPLKPVAEVSSERKKANEFIEKLLTFDGPLLPQAYTASSDTSCNEGGSYAQSYEGIYIIEKNKSYRLFDYLDELKGDEELRYYDYDGDTPAGVTETDDDNKDMDIFYSIGNQIFLKVNQKNSETTCSDCLSDEPDIYSIDENAFFSPPNDPDSHVRGIYPTINSFTEGTPDNGHINIVFNQPTDKKLKNFRLEYYTTIDKFSYDERIVNTKREKEIDITRRKQVIDSFADIPHTTFCRGSDPSCATYQTEGTLCGETPDDTTSICTINKSLGTFLPITNIESLSRGFSIKTKSFNRVGTDLSYPVTVETSAKFYVGNMGTTVNFLDSETQIVHVLILAPSTTITFNKAGEISNVQGVLFKEKATSDLKEYTVGGADDTGKIISLSNMPLTAGTTITYFEPLNLDGKDENEGITLRYYDGTELTFIPKEMNYYELIDLGVESDKYTIRIQKPNDYYYAKTYTFSGGLVSTLSNQILLSPQTENDRQPPNINFNEIIRVPVYLTKEVDFTKSIREDGGFDEIDEIFFDVDLDTDTDEDEDPNNDRDVTVSGEGNPAGYKLTIEERDVKLNIGPFDEIFKKKIQISVIDKKGNIGFKEIPLEVYAPRPNISATNIDGAPIEITGELENSTLAGEPVNIYRFRGGGFMKLEGNDTNNNNSAIPMFSVNTTDGTFSFSINPDKGLQLKSNDTLIADINEETGHISIQDPSLYTALVYPSNNNEVTYPKIIIKRGSTPIYYEYVAVNHPNQIQMVDTFGDIDQQGVYVQNPGSDYFVQPDNEVLNSTIICEKKDNPTENCRENGKEKYLFIIYRDGRINTHNDNYTLEYDGSTKDGYVVFRLLDHGKFVTNVLVIPEKNYIMEAPKK